MKLIITIITFFCIAISVFFYILKGTTYTVSPIVFQSCTARLVILDGDARANLILMFMDNPKKNSGLVTIEGSIYTAGKYNSTIYRQITFTYKKKSRDLLF